jgi:hypothetical protein
MRHILIHIDRDLGPIGAFDYDGELVHFYPDALDPHVSARARNDMAARHDSNIPDWFAYLARREPALDQYETFTLDDNDTSLITVVAEFRKEWNQHVH